MIQQPAEAELAAVQPPSQQGIEELSEAVGGLTTVEEVMKYLEPDRWQVDMEELYRPTWHVLGKSFILNKKAKGTTCCITGSERRIGRFCHLSPCVCCCLSRGSRSQSAEGGRPAVQLHAAQLLCVAARGAGEDGRHLLAQLPAGEALRWKLRLLLPPLLQLSVRPRQGHQEVP